MKGPAWNPAVLAMLRMRPLFRSRIAGPKRPQRPSRAEQFTWTMSYSRASGRSKNAPVEPKPALFTSTSTVRPCALTASKMACGALGSVRSAAMEVARMP